MTPDNSFGANMEDWPLKGGGRFVNFADFSRLLFCQHTLADKKSIIRAVETKGGSGRVVGTTGRKDKGKG